MTRDFQLYIVPTPIGNLGDISLRAIEVLKNVDIIACEDTRNTQKLLNHYQISTKCYSYHKYNEKERLSFFRDLIEQGKRIALVSDAGTPMICDPGNVLIDELRKYGVQITALPGACAITTFLSQVPREDEFFSFIGFIPRTSAQIKSVVETYVNSDLVFYDSPERILKTLSVIKEFRGDVRVAIGRELSKLFEEVNIGTISEIQDRYSEGIKGEIVCLVYRSPEIKQTEFELKVLKLKEKGFKAKEISVILSTLYDVNKNKIYDIAK